MKTLCNTERWAWHLFGPYYVLGTVLGTSLALLFQVIFITALHSCYD
jgi:hypothetical protein